MLMGIILQTTRSMRSKPNCGCLYTISSINVSKSILPKEKIHHSVSRERNLKWYQGSDFFNDSHLPPVEATNLLNQSIDYEDSM